ncbi:trafficking protein particle complex subunit 2 [Microthyrium microscopicum]|uniref:Trafficking protein particle complex subunit 2 n=1 Tax=Microthyrium microscopicum TaxID=703497 RepID=A0A6A6UKA9_9PEZI|nr:trafficking protein particle complex subunit 2 [Microthyrium microscopicum]
MSFYFAIIGTKDNPLFVHEFGTSKQGGDGVARFRDEARHMNPFIVHSSLDILEELQWGSGSMYLKTIDRFQNSHISAFLTGGNIKFLLLSTPDLPPIATGLRPPASSSRTNAAFSSFNPTAPATEEAIKNFFLEVYDAWVKTIMNPFYRVDAEVNSPVFRARVGAAGRKFL